MDKLIKRIIGLLLVTGIISVISCGPALAESKEQLVKTGNALFSSGKYDEAIRSYDEAAVNDPESPVIYFNKGTALYKKEDYSSAIDAFKLAAVKTKDIALEAKSKFNLGLCFFREGERQKDSDLKKTLEAYGSSVQSFQEALKLNPEFTEAAENIEMVRLMMKSVLDEIKKQEEAAKKQQEQMQKTADKIKELIDRQKNLLADSQSLNKDEQTKAKEQPRPDKVSGQNTQTEPSQDQQIADAQQQLKKETENLSEQLAKQSASSTAAPSAKGGAPVPDHPSKQHLDASAGEQENALERLSENDPGTAAEYQQKSLDDLNKALDALNNGQKNPQQGQQQQQKGNQSQQKGEDQQQQRLPHHDRSGDKPVCGKITHSSVLLLGRFRSPSLCQRTAFGHNRRGACNRCWSDSSRQSGKTKPPCPLTGLGSLWPSASMAAGSPSRQASSTCRSG